VNELFAVVSDPFTVNLSTVVLPANDAPVIFELYPAHTALVTLLILFVDVIEVQVIPSVLLANELGPGPTPVANH